MKLTKEEFINFVREEALKIKAEILDEQIENAGDPIDIDMNKHDSDKKDGEKALAYKDRSKKVEKAGPNPEKGGAYTEAKEKMNQQDNDQGHDEEIAAGVKFEAGSKKGGSSHTAGQANSKFTSKKDNPRKEVSAPFDEEKFDGKMNKEDREMEKGAKTYVDAGAKKDGHTHIAGQAQAKPSERAPKVKDKEPIASGIEINGSNIKENYSKSELINFIKEEANKFIQAETKVSKKANQKKTLEEELTKLQTELNSLQK